MPSLLSSLAFSSFVEIVLVEIVLSIAISLPTPSAAQRKRGLHFQARNGSSNDLNCRVVIHDQRGLCDGGSRGRLPEMDGARFRNVTVMQRGLCGFVVFHAAVRSHRSCTSPSANGES